MHGLNDQHGMKLESHRRTRLHVSNASQEQRSQEILVRKALAYACPHFFEQPVTRGILKQADQRLDSGSKTDNLFPSHLFA
jgi:hypothetical protein